jgi:hypothetical protein
MPPASNVVDTRKKTIVDEKCDLFEGAGYCLGETFIVANLMEEIVAVDNDEFPA